MDPEGPTVNQMSDKAFAEKSGLQGGIVVGLNIDSSGVAYL